MQLQSTDVMIPIRESEMGAYLAAPSVPKGSLVLIQEIFGVTPAMRAIADDLASEGYAVLVPDIYWRLARSLDLGNGEDPAERQLAVDYSNRYDEQLGTQDLVNAWQWLSGRFPGTGSAAIAGLCLGGRLAVRVAAAADVSCMISLYGVGLDKLAAELAATKAPVQLHYGENDNHNPMAVIEAVRGLVASRDDTRDEFFTYPEAEHAFYNRFRLDRFDQAAHTLARQRMLSLLARHTARHPS